MGNMEVHALLTLSRSAESWISTSASSWEELN